MTNDQILSTVWRVPWGQGLNIGFLSSVSAPTLSNFVTELGRGELVETMALDVRRGYWVRANSSLFRAAKQHGARHLNFMPGLKGKWKRRAEALLAHKPDDMAKASGSPTLEERRKGTLVRLGEEFERYKAQHEEHNPLGIGTSLDDCYWFPTFPYYPEDQLFITGPPYREVATKLAEICHAEDLIAGAKETIEGPHRVWYIFFYDGDTMRLSDMQCMLMLMGLVKGTKRWNEIENDIKPLMEQKLRLVKIESWSTEPTKTAIDKERVARQAAKNNSTTSPAKAKRRKPKGKKAMSREAQGLLATLMGDLDDGPELDLDDLLGEGPEKKQDVPVLDSDEAVQEPEVETPSEKDILADLLVDDEEDEDDDVLDWL